MQSCLFLIVMRQATKYSAYYLASAFIAVLFCITSCKAGDWGPASYPSARCFKLTEHVEALASDLIEFTDVIGEFTIGKDTRRVLYMGEQGELVFNVDVPVNGKVRFAYGISHVAFRYAGEMLFRGELRGDGEPVSLGEVKLNTRSTDAVGRWFEGEWDIPEGVSGEYELAFILEGQKEGAPKDIFMVAHPTIIDPSVKRKPHRIIWVGDAYRLHIPTSDSS